jgi:hypothetical protein
MSLRVKSTFGTAPNDRGCHSLVRHEESAEGGCGNASRHELTFFFPGFPKKANRHPGRRESRLMSGRPKSKDVQTRITDGGADPPAPCEAGSGGRARPEYVACYVKQESPRGGDFVLVGRPIPSVGRPTGQARREFTVCYVQQKIPREGIFCCKRGRRDSNSRPPA